MTGCSIQNCGNRSENGYRLVTFPRDAANKDVWTRSCGRGKDWTPGRWSRVCEVHFPSSQWETDRKALVKGAVPTLFCVCKQSTTSNCKSGDPSALSSPYQEAPIDHRSYCKPLPIHQKYSSQECPLHSTINKNSTAKRKQSPEEAAEILNLKGQISQLKTQAESFHSTVATAQTHSAFAGKFSDAQLAASLSGNSRGRKWPLSDVQTAMNLCWTGGPSAYKSHQQNSNVAPLPSVRTIQRRTSHIKFEPGLLTEVLDAFEPMIERYSNLDRDCCLLFDDMSIKAKKDFDVSTGKYIGDVTLPGGGGLATKATLYLFAGCRARWKVTAAYHFVADKPQNEIQGQILRNIIERGTALKLNVLAVVCDMGNRGLTNYLGFSTKKNNVSFKIPHPCNVDHPLFLLPDSVHVFKSLKECLVNNLSFTVADSIVNECNLKSNTVHINHIEWFDDHQGSMVLQFAPQLSAQNIRASHFNKMKSSSARNVLNHKVACGLKFKVLTGEAPEEYGTTAWFISLVNRWFDIMTCRGLQLAFSKHNEKAYKEVIDHLKLVVKVFKSIKFAGGWKPVQTHIIVATEAILELQDYLINVRGYSFVMAGRFLQDAVENMFSLVRRKRPNPTALQFKQSLRQIVVARLCDAVKGSSYDWDDRLDPVDLLLFNQMKPQTESGCSAAPNFTPWQEPPTNIPILPKRQEDVMYRMCGYAILKLEERLIIKCENCRAALRHRGAAPHPNSLWVKITNYGDGDPQVSVSDEVFQLLRKVEFNLLRWQGALAHYTDAMLPQVMAAVMPNLASHYMSTCHDVKEKIVKYWVNMSLKQWTKRLTGNPVQSQSQLASKSMGSRLLSDNFFINKKSQHQSPKVHSLASNSSVQAQGKGPRAVLASIENRSVTKQCPPGASVKVKTPAIATPSLHKNQKKGHLSEKFLTNVSNKLSVFASTISPVDL